MPLRRCRFLWIAIMTLTQPLIVSCGGGGGSSAALTGRGSVEGFAYVDAQGNVQISRSPTAPTGMQPASGAAVTIEGTSISGGAGADGRFSLSGIPAGTVRLGIQPSGGQVQTSLVTVFGDAVVRAGAPAISRSAAYDLVKQSAQDVPIEKLLILAAQSPIPAGVTVYPGLANPTGSVNQSLVGRFDTEQWFFLVDAHSAYLFQHPVRYYFVDAQTGALTRIDAESWPLINGVPFYKVSDDNLASPDKVNEPTEIENEPPPRSSSVLPGSSSPRHHVPGCETGTTYVLMVRGSTDSYIRNSFQATESVLRNTYNIPSGNMYTVEPFHPDRPAVSIGNRLKTIISRAQPCDTVLVFVYGHGYDGGFMDGDYAWQPTGLSPFENSQSELVMPETFDFTGLKACHLHMYIECCWSGDWIPTLSAQLLPKTGLDASIITATDGSHRGLALSKYTFIIGVDPVLVFNSYFVEAAGQLGPGAYDPISLFDRTLSNLEAARSRQGWPGAYARLTRNANPQMWVRPRQPGEVCHSDGTQTSFVAPTHSPLVTGAQYAYVSGSTTLSHTIGAPTELQGVDGLVYPTEIRSGGKLRELRYGVSSTTSGAVLHGIDYYNSAGTAVTMTDRFVPGDTIPTGLQLNQPFVQNLARANHTGTGTPVTTNWQYTNTLKAFESVTVPAGTFTGCAKVFREFRRDGSLIDTATCWFAPNVGLVKVQYGSGSSQSLASYSLP